MPLSIGVQLTSRCNLNCRHCMIDGSAQDLPLNVLEKVISFAKACNVAFLAFSGGEPTLHGKFDEVVEMLARNTLAFTMITNGWNFTDWYRSMGPRMDTVRRLGFSLDGATEEVHDLNRADGSYRRVLQAASICRYKGIPFGLRMTVTRRNIHQLEEMALLASKIGAGEVAIIPLQPTPRTTALGIHLKPADFRRINEESARLRKIFKTTISLTAGYFDSDPLVLCPPLSMRQIYVTSDGSLSFCCQLADFGGGLRGSELLGNLAEISVHEAYQRMVDAVAAFTNRKVRLLGDGKLGEMDHFSCWYCLKHFQKVNWMAEMTDDPWAKDLLGTSLCNPVRLAPAD
ncbi:radical SAM protein [Candidatus Poribacteria bacterium]|nr:radical SAM protein [Candidatus Poribacteria bacterium]